MTKSGRAVWIIRNSLPLFGWDGDTLAFESTQSTEGQQELQAWRGDSVHYTHEPGSFVPLVQILQAQLIYRRSTRGHSIKRQKVIAYEVFFGKISQGNRDTSPKCRRRDQSEFWSE
ncbi:hypothetical protein EJO66_30625 [Variovorax beijingensis]|uniref:Uncharacterized protein n=1 Tax=Variovorax beijingensis TaxID=2496117 RepID=A0ABX9ZXJ9_9BURK|nr:hypothetical protein EJO66_30625 [Variovorax beijingensis]